MGCTVEKVLTDNGEPSKLFADLLKTMPESLALEYYLELKSNESKYKQMYGESAQGEVMPHNAVTTDRFKLVEFNSYEEQSDTMNYLAEMLINTFKEMLGVADTSKISGIDLDSIAGDPEVVAKAVNAVRRALNDSTAGLPIMSDQRRLLSNAAANIDRYLIQDGVLGKLGQTLRDRGVIFNIKERKTPVETKYEEKLAEDEVADESVISVQQERIYYMEVVESSPVTSMADDVKIYLRSKHQVASNYEYKGDSPVYAKTALNSNKAAQFERLYGKLNTGLIDIQTPAEMISKIEAMVRTSPELTPILQDLQKEYTGGGVTFQVGRKKYTYSPIAAALFSTFAKHNYDMFSLVKDENGRVYFSNSNQNTTSNVVKTRWAQDIPAKVKALDAKEITKRKTSITTFTNSDAHTEALNSAYSKNQGNIDIPNSPANRSLKAAVRHFNNAGYNITYADLLNSYQDFLTNPKFVKVTDTAFAPFLKSLLQTLVVKAYNKGDIFKATEADKGEGRYIGLLTNAVGLRKDDVTLGSFLSPRKSVLHPLNAAAEAHDVWHRLKKDGEFLSMIGNDPMYANTEILKALSHPEHSIMFRAQTMDSKTDNTSSNPGITYAGLSTFDALLVKMNGYFAGPGKGRYIKAVSPTQADRGNAVTLDLPKFNINDSNQASQIFNADGSVLSKEVDAWVTTQLKSEINRIQRAKRWRGSKVDNYHDGNALQFNLFTTLNDEGVLKMNESTAKILAKAREHVLGPNGALSQLIDADVNYLIDEGLIQESAQGYIATEMAGSFFAKSRNNITTNEMQNFALNNFLYTYEQTLFYMSDPAYYKQNSVKSPTAQVVDINKRFGLPFTPGTKLTVGPEFGIKQDAKIIILEEPEYNSPMSSIYEELGLPKNAFNGIELADGQGYVSLDRFRSMMMARGIHTKEMLKLIDQLESWKPGDKIKSTATLEVLKGFYFRLQQGEHGAVMPFNLKYSIMPAIPSLFEAVDGFGNELHPGMAKISRTLRSGKADEVVMESAVKVGRTNLATFDTLETTAVPTIINNNSYRFPQPSPQKDKIIDKLGSQIRKSIDSNIHEKTNIHMFGESVTAAKAISDYQTALKDITNVAGEKVLEEFTTPAGEVDLPSLVKRILSDLESNSHTNVDYFREALAVVEGDTMLPINYPTLKYKIDNLINGAFRKATTRPEIPGFSGVQTSSLGMEKAAIEHMQGYNKANVEGRSDLKFIRIGRRNSKGKVTEITDKVELAKAATLIKNSQPGDGVSDQYVLVPAEVRITPRYFAKRLKEIATNRVDKRPINEMVADFEKSISSKALGLGKSKIARLVSLETAKLTEMAVEKNLRRLESSVMENGEYSIAKIKAAGLDEVVLYRIPTGGKNYTLPSTIKSFLPEAAGSNIQVPAEIVAQAGSDFDIDKVYVEMFNFDAEDGRVIKHSPLDLKLSAKDRNRAMIVEFHKQVLTSSDTAVELLTPNSTARLASLANKMGLGDTNLTGNLASMNLQETFRTNNQSGKDMIAISSVASSAHAVAQKIGTKFTTPFIVNGVESRLGNTYTNKGKVLISSEIALIQDASLDNAKDPLLGKLNITEFTSAVPLLAIQLGHGLEYAMALVNAPIIKDLSKLYNRYVNVYGRFTAYDMAIDQVESKYRVSAATSPIELSGYSMTMAKEAMVGETPNFKANQAMALKMFIEMKKKGDQLTKTQGILNFDSKGTPASTSGLISKYRAIASVPGTLAYARERSSEKLLVEGVYEPLGKINKVGVDGVRYKAHSMSAFESNTIHKAFEVNGIISPTASHQMQRVLTVARDVFGGYLSELQEIKLIAGYDQFLLSNTPATSLSQANITEYIESGKYLELSEAGSPNSVAYLLKSYRDGLTPEQAPNQFLDNLEIIKQDGREFITFNNTTSRALTGERKKEMMFYFEDLMNHPDNSTEAMLAEKLTKYALTYYGFSTSINSFMEFIPPQAHVEYTKGPNGVDNGTFFKALEGNMNDLNNFDMAPTNFIDQYVQNHYMSLGLKKFPSGLGKKIGEEVVFSFEEGEIIPRYVLQAADKKWSSFNILKNSGNGSFAIIPKLGVPNLAVEYLRTRSESSHQHPVAQVNIKPVAAKANATPENVGIMKTLADIQVVKAYMMNQPILNTAVNEATSKAAISNWINTYGSRMAKADKSNFIDYLEDVQRRTVQQSELNLMGEDYNTTFRTVLENAMDETILSALQPERITSLLETIKTCS